MAEPTYDDDPGWPRGPKLFRFLIPGYIARVKNQTARDGLVTVREIFISFVFALVLFQLTLVGIGTTDAPTNGLFAFGLLALGAVNVLLAGPFIERRGVPDCSSAASLAGWYMTRFFLRIAFAESAALFGFVGFFIANVWWVYPASLITAGIGFVRLAPTRANLERDQEELRSRGCNLSLVQALRQPKAA